MAASLNFLRFPPTCGAGSRTAAEPWRGQQADGGGALRSEWKGRRRLTGNGYNNSLALWKGTKGARNPWGTSAAAVAFCAEQETFLADSLQPWTLSPRPFPVLDSLA